MRSTAWLVLFLVTSSANAGELAGQIVTVVRDRTRVVDSEGTFRRFIPIGARFLVKVDKGEFVELQPVDPDAPSELVESRAVVPAKEAAEFMKSRAERENSVTAWINLAVFLRREDLDEHIQYFTKAAEIEALNARLQTEFARSFELIGHADAQKFYDTAADIAAFESESLKSDRQWFSRSHTISYPHQGVHSPAPRDYAVYVECALGFVDLSSGTNRKERLETARRHFLNALESDLNCTAAFCGLSEVYKAQGRRDDAIKTLSAILERRPFDHVHLIERAELREKTGDFLLARQDFQKAIDVAGTCPCALRERASFYERQHELQLALADLDRARELEPENTRILDQRIQLQASLGAYDGALDDLQTLRRLQPNGLTRRPLEGMLWELKGDLVKAKAAYREFGVGSRDCCRLCMRQGDFAGALEDCNAMVADQRGRIASTTRTEEREAYQGLLIDALRARGYCLERLGRPEEALADYTEWRNAKLGDRVARISRARVLKVLDRNKEAAAEMAQAMTVKNEVCTNFVSRGRAKEAMGDLPGALDDYISADRVHGKCGASLASMAWIYATSVDAELRNGLKAVEEGERAISLKGFPPGRSKDEILAAAYAEAGNFEEAVRQIQKCMSSRDSHGKRELMPMLDRYRRGIVTRSEPWEVYLP